MNQKELTKTFMMISNCKKTFSFDVFYKLIQRFGLSLILCKGFGYLLVETLAKTPEPEIEPYQARIFHCDFHPLQAVNCGRNSRLVVDENYLEWVTNEKNDIVIIKTAMKRTDFYTINNKAYLKRTF